MDPLEPHILEDLSKKYSPSKLDVYKNCPKRFQFRYVDRVSRRRKTPETILGVAVHAAFEQLHERVNGGQSPTVEETKGWFEAAFDEEWEGEIQTHDARFSKDDWRQVGRQCVETYHGQNAPFSADKTVAVEKKVSFDIEVDGHEYKIEGFVDRLSLAPDGAFEIHDYKTAKSLPDQAHADADWQLALYELAVRREWPDTKEVRLKWHYVRHGRTLVSRRDDAARERLRSELAALISTIKHDRVFEHRKSSLCDWCEYKDLCPAFKSETEFAVMTPEQRRADDGAALVESFAAVEEKRHALEGELKVVEKEKKELVKRLGDLAELKGVTAIAGGAGIVSISTKDDYKLPTRTENPEKHAELEAELRAAGLWEDCARVDAHALAAGVKTKRWAGELLAKAQALLARFGHPQRTRTARLKKRELED